MTDTINEEARPAWPIERLRELLRPALQAFMQKGPTDFQDHEPRMCFLRVVREHQMERSLAHAWVNVIFCQEDLGVDGVWEIATSAENPKPKALEFKALVALFEHCLEHRDIPELASMASMTATHAIFADELGPLVKIDHPLNAESVLWGAFSWARALAGAGDVS